MNIIEGSNGVPPEPDWSKAFPWSEAEQAAASEQWKIVIDHMRAAETLALSNSHAIRRLVTNRVMYDRYAAVVIRDGAVNKKGRRTPAYIVMHQLSESILVLESDLGLSPRRRNQVGKISTRRKNQAPVGAAAYLHVVKKPSEDS